MRLGSTFRAFFLSDTAAEQCERNGIGALTQLIRVTGLYGRNEVAMGRTSDRTISQLMNEIRVSWLATLLKGKVRLRVFRLDR